MSWRRFQSEIGRNRNWRQPFENGQNPSEVERNQPELEETDYIAQSRPNGTDQSEIGGDVWNKLKCSKLEGEI